MPGPATSSLVLPDGRRIAWCERGAPDGFPVLAFHGLPGSRLQFHPDESIAMDLQARVIHLERPLILRSPERLIDLIALQMSAADRRTLSGAELRAVLAADAREAFRQGARAFAADLRLSASPWQLDFQAVRCAVRLWHGSDDRLIPVSATHALAGLFPRCEVTIREGEGHFMIFERWHEILSWAVAEHG